MIFLTIYVTGVIIASDNGSLPVQCQVIIWINVTFCQLNP